MLVLNVSRWCMWHTFSSSNLNACLSEHWPLVVSIVDTGTGSSAYLSLGSPESGSGISSGWKKIRIRFSGFRDLNNNFFAIKYLTDPDPGSYAFLTLNPRSGMEKFGSGIKHPGFAALLLVYCGSVLVTSTRHLLVSACLSQLFLGSYSSYPSHTK